MSISTKRSSHRSPPADDGVPEPPEVRILGIDPGSRAAGYGVIESLGQRVRVIDHGVIRVPGELPFPRRLSLLHRELAAVVDRHQPHEAAIEEVFSAHNVRSALVLGQARGVLMLAAADRCEVFEYSARAVKKAVVGYGQADKAQVAQMIKMLLGLAKRPPKDAADALAIALCHVHSRGIRRRVDEAVAAGR